VVVSYVLFIRHNINKAPEIILKEGTADDVDDGQTNAPEEEEEEEEKEEKEESLISAPITPPPTLSILRRPNTPKHAITGGSSMSRSSFPSAVLGQLTSYLLGFALVIQLFLS
jgi:hypothetical protein